MSDIIKGMVKEGEFITIGNTYQYNIKENITNLTIQTALMIAGNETFLGFGLNKKTRILFIDTLDNKDLIFEHILKQLNGKHTSEAYEEIKVLNLDLTALNNNFTIETLKNEIEEEDFDIIIWNDINIIHEHISQQFKKTQSNDNPLEHTLYLIKKISGMKTKIISHLYNSILEKKEFNKINEIAAASLILNHKNIVSGYQIEFFSRHNKNKSISKLVINEEKNNFYIQEIKTFLNETLLKEELFKEPRNPLSL